MATYQIIFEKCVNSVLTLIGLGMLFRLLLRTYLVYFQ